MSVEELVWQASRNLANHDPVDWPETLERSEPTLAIAEGQLDDLAYAEVTAQLGGSATAAVRAFSLEVMKEKLTAMDADGLRLGPRFYRVTTPGKWMVADWTGLAGWLAANTVDPVGMGEALSRLFAAYNVRVTGVRDLAEGWGQKPEAAVDTFLTYKYRDDPQIVSAIPLTRAPKFAQRLDEGALWFDNRKEKQ